MCTRSAIHQQRHRSSVSVSSQDDATTLRKAHTRSALSLNGFLQIVLETKPMLVWWNTVHTCLTLEV